MEHTLYRKENVVDVTYVGFSVNGEMDNRRYELTIGFNEMPTVFAQTGSNTAYYLDQVESYLYEPDGDDEGWSIMITIHQDINPGYNLAVRRLIGDVLSDLIQDRGTYDSELDLMRSNNPDASHESVRQAFLEERINEAEASQILHRVLLNSTFL